MTTKKEKQKTFYLCQSYYWGSLLRNAIIGGMSSLLYNYSELIIHTQSYKICGLCKQSHYIDISLTSPYKKLETQAGLPSFWAKSAGNGSNWKVTMDAMTLARVLKPVTQMFALTKLGGKHGFSQVASVKSSRLFWLRKVELHKPKCKKKSIAAPANTLKRQ